MRQLFFLLFFLIIGMCTDSQAQFDQKLANSYETYKESSITDRRFKHETIEKLED